MNGPVKFSVETKNFVILRHGVFISCFLWTIVSTHGNVRLSMFLPPSRCSHGIILLFFSIDDDHNLGLSASELTRGLFAAFLASSPLPDVACCPKLTTWNHVSLFTEPYHFHGSNNTSTLEDSAGRGESTFIPHRCWEAQRSPRLRPVLCFKVARDALQCIVRAGLRPKDQQQHGPIASAPFNTGYRRPSV